MQDLFANLLPYSYQYQLIVQLNMCAQLLLSGLVFFRRLPKERHWVFRLLLSLFLCLSLLSFCVALRTQHGGLATRFVMRFLQFAMPLIVVGFCYRESIYAKLGTWCAGIAAMEIGAALYSFLLALLGIDERQTISLIGHGQGAITMADWGIYFALHLFVYALLYHWFSPRSGPEVDYGGRLPTMVLTLACLVFLTIPDCVSNEFRDQSWPMLLVNRSYLLFLSAFILAFCHGIELQSSYRMQMQVMDQILAQERKRYAQLRENIDLINMHCHDLKHQLEDFSGKLTQQEISSLREAMEIYDRNIKTGNEALDVVIYLCQLSCEKAGIELTCLADGAALSFMQTRHVYSLFQNALGNALEALQEVSDPEKRVLGLTVARKGGVVEVEVFNYFQEERTPSEKEGGTSKADKGRHGFGLPSMRYIVGLYHGTLLTQTQRDIYSLHLSIPIPTPER